jgi:hypothetical protein
MSNLTGIGDSNGEIPHFEAVKVQESWVLPRS